MFKRNKNRIMDCRVDRIFHVVNTVLLSLFLIAVTYPFLYIISERSTGSIFFMGQFMGDTTTGIGDALRLAHHERQLKGKVYDLQGRQVNGLSSNRKGNKGLYIADGKKVAVK